MKNVIIFLFSYKMITTTNYNTQKISLGSLQNKKSREGIEYQNIPILYDGKRSIVHLCGRFKLEEDVSFDSSPNYSNSLGVDVWIWISAKWHQNSGRFFAKMGKSTKKQFGTKKLYLENILKVK